MQGSAADANTSRPRLIGDNCRQSADWNAAHVA